MPYYKFICVIVDAYSTGKYLAPILTAQGYPCIHIKSSPSLPFRFQHNENNFIENVTYENDIEHILSCLKSYIVKFCIPGYESGVELADLLNEKLGLPGNKSEFSVRKRNKYLMNEAVTAENLPTVKHYYSNTLPSLINWVKTINNYPVVAKPLDSANGDGVHFCNNDEELQIAFQHITSSHNQFGVQNKEILVEALNIGDEYIINTVSYGKKHFIAEIWKVTRKGLTTIYDKAEILSDNEDEWDILG
ncbi:MAG: ATP-grasp domain-containing protein, partial [Silvanigrellaceae bacterium]|nr:ATP-grasp domain-containing protein [Silvanigrellaceae bacterium]